MTPRRATASVLVTAAIVGAALVATTPAIAAPDRRAVIGADVERISGADRYATAVEISKEGFGVNLDYVYIATGENYPDALSAGAAAAERNAPLLLVRPDSIPDVVITELIRLNPTNIVVVGGPASISAPVFDALQPYGNNVYRREGADRYATSRAVIRDAFPGVATIFIATGANFPDALSATPAASRFGAPVLLVPGGGSAIDTATSDLIFDLGVTKARIVGGTGAVSAGIQSSIDAVPGVNDVARLEGIDRYATSVAINRSAFANATNSYLATGESFADALAGGALAASAGGPLYISTSACIPPAVAADIEDVNTVHLFLLGGENALSAAVFAKEIC